jgi:hypothetical protein
MSRRSQYLRKTKKASHAPTPSGIFKKKPGLPRPSRTYYLRSDRKIRKALVACLSATLLFFLAYFFLFSDFFRIERIIVKRESSAYSGPSDAQISGFLEPFLHTRRWLILPQGNSLFFDGEMAADMIHESAIVGDLKIYSRGRILTVEMGEVPPVAVLSAGGHYYYLNGQGIAEQGVLPGKVNPELPVISDSRTSAIEPGREAIDGQAVRFIAEFAGLFRRQFGTTMSIVSFSADGAEIPDIVAEVSEGWKIYLDKTVPAAGQMDNLKLILDGQVKDQRLNLEYVKLDAGNRVFYKLKSASQENQ